MRPILVVAFVFVACSALAEQSTSLNTSPKQPERQASADNQSETKTVSPSVPSTPVPPEAQGNATPKGNGTPNQPYPWHEWLLPQAASNLLVAIVGIGAFAIGLGTLFAIKKQNRINFNAFKASRRSALAAQTSANAAQQSAEAQFTQLKTLYVPCLEFPKVWVDPDIGANDPGPVTVSISIEIHNAGATTVQIRGITGIVQRRPPQDNHTSEQSIVKNLGVNRDMGFAIPWCELSAQERDSYEKGNLVLGGKWLITIYDPSQGKEVTYPYFRRFLCGRDNPAKFGYGEDPNGPVTGEPYSDTNKD